MPKDRTRLQIDLPVKHRLFLQRFRARLGGNDAEAARKAIELVDTAADRIQHGYKMVAVPLEDERPDAMPELTRAVRPELNYSYLVSRPHPWRKQLSFKGRRLTVGQFLHAMRINDWSPEQAAEQFDLPLEAAYEGLEYGEQYAELIDAEAAEEARAAKSVQRAATAG
jgi:uncharacterized protein (DUF433 family)